MRAYTGRINQILVRTYHNILLMEETKRKHSRTNTSFRGRNAMEYLYESEEGEKKMSEIAEYLKISRPSATQLIKKLESLGYVEKKGDRDDERSSVITLTRKGKHVAAIRVAQRIKACEAVCEEFTDEELEILCRGFSKMNDAFEECIGKMDDF